MTWRLGCLSLILFSLCGCFATFSAPTVIPVSDLTPPATSGVTARELAFPVVMDRFRDERSNRSILGQYDYLGKGGFAGTITLVPDRDVTEVFEDLVKKSLNRKGIRQGPSPFIMRGAIRKVVIGAAPNSETLRAEAFLELSIVDSNSGARLWQKAFLGAASGVDPKSTLALAFQDLSVSVDQDDTILALRQTYLASGGKLPDVAAAPQSMQTIPSKRPVSDVDELPAIQTKQNKNAYAIVIGIEQYRQKLPKVDFAAHDARVVSEYLTRVLGYPEENIVILINENAAKSDFEKYFEKWLSNNVEKDSSVLVYYSGHGSPNIKTGDAYLVPFDGDPAFIDQTGYSLKRLYDSLGKLPAKEIVVALDSCFSGAGGRSVISKGARPLVMNLETSMVLSPKIAVITAASGEQVSSTYEEKGHGLFTYFMLKAMKGAACENQKGRMELEELFNYIKPNVERIARKNFNNEQSPQLLTAKQSRKIYLRD